MAYYLMTNTAMDEFAPITQMQSQAWDAMAKRGHELETGAWQVFSCAESRRHEWHALCAKVCDACGQRVSLEVRYIAGSTQLRVVIPRGRCGS